ncbi:MAG: hypothetical protein ACTSO7_05305 [Candidatus Heimdallarchaeota archaeon]
MSRRPSTSKKESRIEDDLFDPDKVKKEEDTFRGFPKRNELVVATVEEVAGHGAYVSLDEYDIFEFTSGKVKELSPKFFV